MNTIEIKEQQCIKMIDHLINKYQWTAWQIPLQYEFMGGIYYPMKLDELEPTMLERNRTRITFDFIERTCNCKASYLLADQKTELMPLATVLNWEKSINWLYEHVRNIISKLAYVKYVNQIHQKYANIIAEETNKEVNKELFEVCK